MAPWSTRAAVVILTSNVIEARGMTHEEEEVYSSGYNDAHGFYSQVVDELIQQVNDLSLMLRVERQLSQRRELRLKLRGQLRKAAKQPGNDRLAGPVKPLP